MGNIKKLSVVMPVYNEKRTILEILSKVNSVDLKDVDKEIVIVDDCSKDGTRDILKELKDSNIKVVYHERNQGKGAAIRTGLRHITGDVVIIQDSDLEYYPEDYIDLLAIIEQGAEAVYGSRLKHKDFVHKYSLNLFATKLLSLMSNVLYGTKITDEPTCYKMFRTNVIKKINLKCTGFEFCPEVTAKIAKMGVKIKEIPIRYNPRSIAEGKKVNWKDGVEAIWTLIKYRFVN